MPKKKPGDVRFTDLDTLTWRYRQWFLRYCETDAPEVLSDLKALVPKLQRVINDFPYTNQLTHWLSGEINISDPAVAELFRRSMLDDLAVKDRYKITDAALLPAAEETAWKNCVDLKASFAKYLETFELTLDWLRQGLFRLLTDIARSPIHFNSLCYVYSHAWCPMSGEPFELQLDGWAAEESWLQFEANARAAFEEKLASHKIDTIKLFRDNGYKRTTKPLDFRPVKWLVYWTVKRWSKDDILDLIDSEGDNIGFDIKALEKHFRNFKKFGLPVRTL